MSLNTSKYSGASMTDLFTKVTPGVCLAICILSFVSTTQSIATETSKLVNKVAIDTTTITISGLSAGGYMANQYHLSHPEQVSGVAIIAAGPYNCARNSIMTALSECVNKAPDEYPANIADISEKFLPLGNTIKNDKVWLLHGTLDTRIVAKVTNALHHQYSQIIDADNLRYINDKPFSHLFPTQNTGVKCDISETPFIGNCDYDAAGEFLKFINGSLKPKASAQEVHKLGRLVKVDQAEIADISGTGMHQFGYAYVPVSCNVNNKPEACKLHVSFHGCNQSIDNVSDQYASNTGINEWAANNSIVVLYPQVAKSTLMPMNPQACWDWWGYTDENYTNENGKQIIAIHQLTLGLEDYLNK